MKAITLLKYGKAESAFEIREIEKPTPKAGEVLIKVNYSGINFADIIARNGMYPDAPKNPAVLGYDVTGVVVDSACEKGQALMGKTVVALTRFGGYAEYAIGNIAAVAEVPAGYDEARATALATQACTAYYCAIDSTTLHKGDRVLVQAASGGVGSALVQIAKSEGCIVYGTASSSKLTYLKELGVDYAIDYTKEDFAKVIQENEKDHQIDVVFDSIGGLTFAKAMKLLAPGGKMVCYGAAEQLESKTNKLKLLSLAYGFGLFSPINLLMQSKALIMVNMLRIADYKPQLFSMVLNNTVRLAEQGVIEPRLDKIFSADQIAEAHEYVESRKSMGKVVLKWS